MPEESLSCFRKGLDITETCIAFNEVNTMLKDKSCIEIPVIDNKAGNYTEHFSDGCIIRNKYFEARRIGDPEGLVHLVNIDGSEEQVNEFSKYLIEQSHYCNFTTASKKRENTNIEELKVRAPEIRTYASSTGLHDWVA